MGDSAARTLALVLVMQRNWSVDDDHTLSDDILF